MKALEGDGRSEYRNCNQICQSLRAVCPDAMIIRGARRLDMHVTKTSIAGTRAQWEELRKSIMEKPC